MGTEKGKLMHCSNASAGAVVVRHQSMCTLVRRNVVLTAPLRGRYTEQPSHIVTGKQYARGAHHQHHRAFLHNDKRKQKQLYVADKAFVLTICIF